MTDVPNIEKFTNSLSKKIQANPDKYQIIGRDEEVRKVIESLVRRTKNSPVLVGEAGVGKTAIVEGLVKRQLEQKLDYLNSNEIQDFAVSRVLNAEVVELSIASLQGENFLQNFEGLINELKDHRDEYILFIDEVHMIMGAGGDNGSLDMSNLLKPTLARGDFMVITATTQDEYQEYIEKDNALERRLQKIVVKEPSVDEAIMIMNGLKPSLEQYYGVEITDEAIQSSVKLSKRYDHEHYLPDKSIDLLESAAARIVLTGQTTLDDLDIADQVEERTGIPTSSITKSNATRGLLLTETLNSRVLGQPRATAAVGASVRNVLVKHNKPGQPLGSLLFLGPSGTGKTELAKAAAVAMFDDEENMLRFDMSEYKEAGATQKFIERATASVRKNPYTIVLLDEIEKASKDVFDLLLQVLQDGVLTNQRGKTADFSNTYIIMTSNAGFKYVDDKMTFEGMTTGEFGIKDSGIMKDVKQELQNIFRPELINRIDDIVLFNQLTKEITKEITELRLREYSQVIERENNWEISYGQDVIDYIADTSYEPEYGARPIARTIREKIDHVLAFYILAKQIEEPNARFFARIYIVKDEDLHLEENSRYDDRKIEIELTKIL